MEIKCFKIIISLDSLFEHLSTIIHRFSYPGYPNFVRDVIHTAQGVFLVTTKNAFVPVERVYSVNTYLRNSLSHEGVSEVSERARERSERAKRVKRAKRA